jgi:predicted SprT family Zn-dependent metalloprotease
MRKTFQIPESFQLHGQTIRVIWVETLQAKNDARGEAHLRSNEIHLQSHTASVPNPPTDIEQAFVHELIHWILNQMNHKLNNNEAFVNLFASLLHQALTTAEYRKGKK